MDSNRLASAVHDLQEQTEFLDELGQNIEEYKAVMGSVRRAYEEAEAGMLKLDFLTERVKERLVCRLCAKVESIENVVKELKHRLKDTVYAIRQLLGKLDEDFAKYGDDFGSSSNKDVMALERALSVRKLAWVRLMEAQNNYLAHGSVQGQ